MVLLGSKGKFPGFNFYDFRLSVFVWKPPRPRSWKINLRVKIFPSKWANFFCCQPNRRRDIRWKYQKMFKIFQSVVFSWTEIDIPRIPGSVPKFQIFQDWWEPAESMNVCHLCWKGSDAKKTSSAVSAVPVTTGLRFFLFFFVFFFSQKRTSFLTCMCCQHVETFAQVLRFWPTWRLWRSMAASDGLLKRNMWDLPSKMMSPGKPWNDQKGVMFVIKLCDMKPFDHKWTFLWASFPSQLRMFPCTGIDFTGAIVLGERLICAGSSFGVLHLWRSSISPPQSKFGTVPLGTNRNFLSLQLFSCFFWGGLGDHKETNGFCIRSLYTSSCFRVVAHSVYFVITEVPLFSWSRVFIGIMILFCRSTSWDTFPVRSLLPRPFCPVNLTVTMNWHRFHVVLLSRSNEFFCFWSRIISVLGHHKFFSSFSEKKKPPASTLPWCNCQVITLCVRLAGSRRPGRGSHIPVKFQSLGQGRGTCWVVSPAGESGDLHDRNDHVNLLLKAAALSISRPKTFGGKSPLVWNLLQCEKLHSSSSSGLCSNYLGLPVHYILSPW